MKTLLSLLIILAVCGCRSYAQTDSKATSDKAITELICPVTGEEADPDVSYAYQGKTYYFCCKGCVTKFKKDPAKYIKDSSAKTFEPCDHGAEGKEAKEHNGTEGQGHEMSNTSSNDMSGNTTSKGVINEGKDMSEQIVNTKCPVMGSDVDKGVTTVTYKDKVYGFCCKGCIKKFADNPEKYLKN